MSYDLGKAVGHRTADKPISWTRKDVLIYALGVGAKKDDLSLVYELDKGFTPLPTYPVALEIKGDGTDVPRSTRKPYADPIPGLPNLKLDTMSVEVLKDLPAESGPGWKSSSRICAVHEKRSGIIVERESLLVDRQGNIYAKLFNASIYLGAKANADKFSKVIATAPQAKPIPKDRKPDWVTPEQALIYRLSGGYGALHIDSAVGEAAGFGDVILHGLSSFGFAARGIIQEVASGNMRALRTQAWEVGSGPNGTTEITFITMNVTSSKIALGNGVAFIEKAEKSKL